MADDDLKLPSDTEFRMMKIEADHILQQYRQVRGLLYLHEQELLLLWLVSCGTIALVALCYRDINRLRREVNGSDRA